MSKVSGKYEINEKDIESVLAVLKEADPVNATAEMAIDILEYLQTTFHNMSHEDPEALIKIFNELKKAKKDS